VVQQLTQPNGWVVLYHLVNDGTDRHYSSFLPPTPSIDLYALVVLYTIRYILMLLIPVMLIAFIASYYIGYCFCWRSTWSDNGKGNGRVSADMHKLTVSRAWVSLLILLYSALIHQTFSLFQHDTVGNGSRLRADYSIIVGSSQYISMVAIALIIGLICYTLGIPALLIFLGSRTWGPAGGGWSQRASILGTAFESYKPQYW
jgi:hypothetical protein